MGIGCVDICQLFFGPEINRGTTGRDIKVDCRKHPVRLYTADKISGMDKVEVCGPVDYVKEMPYVFKNTKINLNMTLRSIWTGIPLRAIDVMGCGGFLLTNYQADFLISLNRG